ncbi:MAG TPA: glycosyltransferase [Terracidiphilus sp.]|jgi:glycosyltransferase involved in cell wall biosynthesis
MPRFLVGIPVHSEPQGLKASLASLAANTLQDFDLLLLGDGPDEETRATLTAMAGIPQSNVDQPRGLAAAFNRLLRHTSAEIYIFLESGAQVAPGWLDCLLQATQSYPQCGLAGPSTNRGWNEQCIYPTARDSADEIARIALVAQRRFGAACRTLQPLHSLGDFCYLVRRGVVDAIGEADEAYELGPCWEMDYNIRAARAGFLGFWACASYVHRAPATARRQRDEAIYLETGKHLYQDKFCGLRLRGLKGDYRSHCRGSACSNFAPPALIQIRHPAPAFVSAPYSAPAASVTVTVTEMPLVSCIMPTNNRRAFLPRSLRCFFSQDYPNLELVVVDDGADPISDLIPKDHRIRHWRLPKKLSVGGKRNYANARAKGTFIVHWDDDDWYTPSRVRRQIAPLLQSRAQVSGTSTLYYYNHEKDQAFRYEYRGNRPWVTGNTLAYRRVLWERRPFESIQVAEDVKFLAPLAPELICDLRDLELCVGTIHPANVSPKLTNGSFWAPEPAEKVRAILGREVSLTAPEPTASTYFPLVSCIMPTFNRRPFIPLALACFRDQTYPNKELLVVDDGTDPVADLIQQDELVRYIRLERRLNVGAKRNLACEQARGTFIAHWDDDDWYSPERLTLQVAPLRAGTHDLTGLLSSHILQMPDARFWTTNETLRRRMFVGEIVAGTLVYDRSLWLHGIRYPEINLAEDALFIRRATEKRKRILRLSSPGTFIYLRHGQNTWKFDSGRFLDPSGWMLAANPPGFSADLLEAYRCASLQAGR